MTITTTVQHRTQFDEQLLPSSHDAGPHRVSNTGRQVVVAPDGTIITALAWAGDTPMLRIWRNHELVVDHPLDAEPSAPCLIPGPDDRVVLWISLDQVIHVSDDLNELPRPVEPALGQLWDVACDANGATWAAVGRDGRLQLARLGGDKSATVWDVADDAGKASLDFDAQGRLHLAFEHEQGLEYRRFDQPQGPQKPEPSVSERAAEAYGFHPALLAEQGRVFLAYLGESCRPPVDPSWSVAQRRLGDGGYVAALVRDQSTWQRHELADSKQVAKRLRPTNEPFEGNGPNDELRVGIEQFSPPTIALGPDGVAQVYWANLDRRWVYASRYLGETFSPAGEIRGPLEQLTGPCLVPRRVAKGGQTLPIAPLTKFRVYLDELALARHAVSSGRTIDFLQPDELAECRSLELVVSQLHRHPENPLIPVGKRGSFDDGGVGATVFRDPDRWRAEYGSRCRAHPEQPWIWSGRAESADGIHWTKLPPQPIGDRYFVEDRPKQTDEIRYLEDPDEPDPSRRFKGVRSDMAHLGSHGWASIVSPDAVHWKIVPTENHIRADNTLRLFRDLKDVPQRRWKASAIAPSHGGRICGFWYCADGIDWQCEREMLDFRDPFGADPVPQTTGRMIIDGWAGPPEEDEVHGGQLLRDGDRLLCHYDKWTADGHIYCALASSRDGLNFTRVGGGSPTLPLGGPGTWDAGRVSLWQGAIRLGDTWRQYYTGCGWKHGLAGRGSPTSSGGFSCPNQMGLATITVGRWAALRLCRDARDAELLTIPLTLSKPHRLQLNIQGLGEIGSAVACEVLDAQTHQPIRGFDAAHCDAITADGLDVPVTWRDQGLETVNSQSIRLRATLHGWGLKLYGLRLEPV